VKANSFEPRLLFFRQWKVYVLPRFSKNKHSREAQGGREK